jgi:hypothetical protein
MKLNSGLVILKTIKTYIPHYHLYLAINNPPLFASWNFANCLADISLVLSSFQSWITLKVSRSANFRAHVLGKWAASHLVFGSIPTGSTILSSIRIRSGKDPPL